MRPASVNNSWSLLKLKKSTASSGGARRWLIYVLAVVLLVYISIGSWFAFRLVSFSNPVEDSTLESQQNPPVVKESTESRETPLHEAEYTADDIHIVFSTGCNLFQHWQAEVLMYSHMKVSQKGKITRVVSGCDTEAQKRSHAKFLTQ